MAPRRASAPPTSPSRGCDRGGRRYTPHPASMGRGRKGRGQATRRGEEKLLFSRRRDDRLAQLVELRFRQGFLLEELMRPGFERRAIALEDGERLLVGRVDDRAHRDVDLARGFLAVLAVALRQRAGEKGCALLLVCHRTKGRHHRVA